MNIFILHHMLSQYSMLSAHQKPHTHNARLIIVIIKYNNNCDLYGRTLRLLLSIRPTSRALPLRLTITTISVASYLTMVIDVVLCSFKCRRIIDNPLVDHTSTNKYPMRRHKRPVLWSGALLQVFEARFYCCTHR